ncbi:hypothetical protein Agub_g11353 [Astrephomene gubernaculifera]|uniref:Transmembrane protein 216 n=1 Tax=Astrephomene gubernaculifera TaxID=47775 RepID=A0AAD3HQP9_9CHLO|nr:hypothetical protein Agub_g11353 [Astrephomene gubernaculifera]
MMNLGQPSTGPLAPSALGGQAGNQQPQKPRRRVLTSLGFQIFIFFGGWWDVAYYILNILVFVYKGLQLPYPNRNFSMEFCFSWLWILIEAPRLFLASKGNKTERAAPIIFSTILAMPLLAMYIYFVGFQTYVLKIDQILNAISIIFMGIQLLFSVLVTVRFIMATRFT